MPSVGDKAPQFNLKDGEGQTVRLSDYKGRKIVLYFYPRDMTPGCTKEACGFQGDIKEYERRNAVVLGVSTDDSRSHQRFSQKYSLAFTLLADTEHRTAEQYGVWQEKNMYGRKIWGIKRTTFIIDENGHIARVFEKISPAEHSREVLDALDGLDKAARS